jgi:hypothetical protein
MGTIVTVHGTFAHAGEARQAPEAVPWWHPDSAFADQLCGLVRGADGNVDVRPFVWSGANSEQARRDAGDRLLFELEALDAAGRPYCVVGHSHGGSVISAALLRAAAAKRPLPGLRRWITVGTPFVEVRPERFLFMRLPLFLKALYVASLMLFVLLLGAVIGGASTGAFSLAEPATAIRAAIAAVLASLPSAAFYVFAKLRERRTLAHHRPSVKRRAATYFADRWLALTHEDDEAVRGLGTLRKIDVPIFDRDFAVPVLSLVSVFILPVLYVLVINAPGVMMGLADMLRSDVYQARVEARTAALERSRADMRQLRAVIRDARKVAEDTLAPLHERQAAEKTIATNTSRLQVLRSRLHTSYPDLPQLERALRFQRRFLEKDGKLCNAGRLCGDGRDWALNARLLLHLVTDEAASLFVDEEVRRSAIGRVIRFAVPILLVPVVFGLAAILLVMAVQGVARLLSRAASVWLDRVTWRQIRRTAFGLDTEDEVAVGTAPAPTWIAAGSPFLPPGISRRITECANEATFRSLGKFRNALSDIVRHDGAIRATDTIGDYLTWTELIHTAYFLVPEFSQLLAAAIVRDPGFEATPRLSALASDDEGAHWLVALSAGPGTGESVTSPPRAA